MTDDRLQQRADRLAAQVEALAAVLRASGVAEEASMQVLSHASAAVVQALSLELLLERSDTPPDPGRQAQLDIRLAA